MALALCTLFDHELQIPAVILEDLAHTLRQILNNVGR